MQEIFKYTRTGTAPDGAVEGHFRRQPALRATLPVRARRRAESIFRARISIPPSRYDAGVMPFEIDTPTLIVACAAISVVLFRRGRVSARFFSGASYRKNVKPPPEDLAEPAGSRGDPDPVAARAWADQRRPVQFRPALAQPV